MNNMKKSKTAKTRWDRFKELYRNRKPSLPPNKVEIPKTEYNRKDNSWKDESYE